MIQLKIKEKKWQQPTLAQNLHLKILDKVLTATSEKNFEFFEFMKQLLRKTPNLSKFSGGRSVSVASNNT